MSVDPADLLSQAAATLVAAAAADPATDTWSEVRQGFVHLFRSSADADSLSRRLDGTAEKVGQVTGAERERVRAELVGSWRTRLADLLEDHPEAAAELARLVGRGGAAAAAGTINAQSYDQSTMIIAPGGTVNVDRNRRR